jgi:hypothetical protein
MVELLRNTDVLGPFEEFHSDMPARKIVSG